MDFLLPFSTYFCENPDFDGADSQKQSEQLIQRQELIQQVVYGEEQINVLLDLLEQQGIDPVDYVSFVEINVKEVIDNKVLVIPPLDLVTFNG